MTKRVAILISGGGSNMMALVRDMIGDHPARPVLVLANSPDAGGLAKAEAAGIPTVVVDHRAFNGDRVAFQDQIHKELLQVGADIVCLAGFMRILTADFTSKWDGRMINIHPSLLPKYTGLNTHARAIDAGDAQAGCTVHEVTAVLDDGPILGQGRLNVMANDTPQTLAQRVLAVEHMLYPQVLRRYAAGDKSPLILPLVT